jgi:NNP family nitrate/nitrite transporter-like MFS transporter
MTANTVSTRILIANTVAFAACFMVWTMYGVLVTFLVDNGLLQVTKAQIGWLIGAPILTGSLLRLPVGLLTDRFGGKPVYIGVMLVSAVALYLTSYARDFNGFLWGGLAFGLCGASFAVGVAYTALWFPRERVGGALGLFGMGNIGTAITALGAPLMLKSFTENGERLDGWRTLPQVYAIVLVVVAVVFALLTVHKRLDESARKPLSQMLSPLRQVRVWRFGLYYFLLFGGFVALAQWLIPYYVTVYGMTLAAAGGMATLFSMPSALTRAVGGFLSDRFGARSTLYVVLSGVAILFLLLTVPRMDITSPGEGVLADRPGTVTRVEAGVIQVDATVYKYKARTGEQSSDALQGVLVWPRFDSWQEPAVAVGDKVTKKQVLARGQTHIFFQANQGVFTGLLFVAGILMGLGMAAVYKHIPEYFPTEVGVVGGLVGVLGGLGGFVLPIVFGSLLGSTGIWTTCWLFLAGLALACAVWMHMVVLKIHRVHEKAEAAERSRSLTT